MMSLSFLIPAYNDGTSITAQVNEANQIGKKLAIPYEIIVVDDASSDQTHKSLSSLSTKIKELRFISHKINKGYGETIKDLYYEAKKEWLFTIPGDYQIRASEVLKLIPHSNYADMILGWRTHRHDTGVRQSQSRVYNLLIPLLFQTGTHDVNTVRLMKTKIMKTIDLHGTSAFIDAQLIIKAKRSGYTIKEIPIDHMHRQTGTGSGGGGKLKVILPTIWEMFLLFFGLL